MRDLPPDENLGRRRQRRRRMDLGMLALVLSAVFLGLVLIVYFVLVPPVTTPVPIAGRPGKFQGEAKPYHAPSKTRASRLVTAESAKAGTPHTEVAEVEAREEENEHAPPESAPQRVGRPELPAGANNDEVRIDLIVASVVPTPNYTLVEGSDKRFRTRSWLQVEVDFTTFPAAIRELTLHYAIALRGETFAGAVRHADLTLGSHRSVAYLVPARTERFLANGKLPGRVLESVVITAYDRGRLVARGRIGNDASGGGEPIDGFIRSLEQTPFFPLAADQYEPVAPRAPVKPKEKRAPLEEPASRFTQTSTSRE